MKTDRPTQPPTAEEVSDLADFESSIKMAGENHARLMRLLAISGRTLSGMTRAIQPDKEKNKT